MYTAQEARPHAHAHAAAVATAAQATPPEYGHHTTYTGGYPGYENPSSTYHQGGYTYNNNNTNSSYPHPQPGNLHPSHSQHPGGYENLAAPYQAGNSYSSTDYQAGASSGYYNVPPAVPPVHGYQNPAGSGYAQHSSYSSQWTGTSSYVNYGAYSSYTGGYPQQDASTGNAQAMTTQYSQDYQQQWASYYANLQNSSKVEDLDECTAPGTEPPAPEAKPLPYSQPPPPGTQPGWDLNEPSYPDVNTTQVGAIGPSANGGPFISSGFQTDHYSHVQSGHFQQPSYIQQSLQDQPLHFQSHQEQHAVIQPQQVPPAHSQGINFQPKIFPSSVTEPSQRRAGNLQIPTNPRIISTLGMGTKVTSADSSQVRKPAYVAVSGKTSSKDTSNDSMLQPSMFPPSLRAYVERALSRCKDEAQKKACQEIMKEMITKTSTDGSLFTKDWDTEPLFPLPTNIGPANGKETLQTLNAMNSFPKQDQSPIKRSKSRWEPILEEKLDEKADVKTPVLNKNNAWNVIRGGEASVSSVKWERQDGVWNKTKALLHQQSSALNSVQRAAKKPRKDGLSYLQEGNNSSEDSESEAATVGGVCLGTLTTAETPEEKMRRQSRTKRFDKGKDIKTVNKDIRQGKMTVGASARRATAMLLARNAGEGSGGAVEDINWDALTVKGTCQEVEKRYLRLTSAPDPNTVRPEDILRKALVLVQTTQKNYLYKCEQLKSIRQDLTVQRIRNELTVQVYETHARMALEAGDLPEYNQCQSQLKGLYVEGIQGSNKEFTAYNLLYIIFNRGNNRDLLSSMARLSMEDKKDTAIKHALTVRDAVSAGNYTSFFRLYRMAPNLGTCLMDLQVEKMRFEALRCMTRAYRPTLQVSYIGRILGFIGFGLSEASPGKDQEELDECEEWLRAHGAVLVNDSEAELCIDCKASSSSLFMPEPEDAVAHGDANLALNDFFTQV